jgi:hypothetical protein
MSALLFMLLVQLLMQHALEPECQIPLESLLLSTQQNAFEAHILTQILIDVNSESNDTCCGCWLKPWVVLRAFIDLSNSPSQTM